MRGIGLRALLLILLAAMPAASREADPFSVELIGIGEAPVVLTRETLRDLPPVEMDVTFQTSKGQTSKGQSTGSYAGVLLWDVLQAEGAFGQAGHNQELKRTFVVAARDGYEIAFSIGEIHPDFGNTRLMLADRVDGETMKDGFRVVVPGDKRGARNVREVVRIEFR